MITIVSGTNRKKSVSKQVALIYQSILKDLNMDSSVIDLEELPADFTFTALYENEGKNEQFNPFRDEMQQADKLVFIVPEYNGSFPGVLKAFIDGLPFPGSLKGKKCALVGISSGVQGGIMAMSHLTDILNYLGMHVLALKPKIIHIGNKMDNGEITDEGDLKRLKGQANALIEF